MASPVSDEQLQLRRRARRRLVGAITLVTIVAVVLPWILESEPQSGSTQDISLVIPSPDTPIATPPAPAAPAAESVPPAKPPLDTLKAEQEKVLAPPEPKSRKPKPIPPSDPTPKPPAPQRPSAAPAGQFVVQVAALADAEKAAAIRASLEGKGLKAYTEVVKVVKGEVTRVRVGPFPSREAAEKVQAELRALGFDGHVTAK